MANERIRYPFDEHIPCAVAKALRRYGIDVTVPSDVKLLQASDSSHLAYALQNGRVMVTQDADYIRLHAKGVPHMGIAYSRSGMLNVGDFVEQLIYIYEASSPDEMQGHVEYI